MRARPSAEGTAGRSLATAVGAARRAAALAVAALLAATAARAHFQPFSVLDLDVRPGEIRARLTLNREDAAREIGLAGGDSLADSTALAVHAPRLAAVLAPRLRLAADGVALAPLLLGAEPVRERMATTLLLRYPLARPPGEIAVSGTLDPTDPNYQVFVNVFEDGRIRMQDVVSREKPVARHFLGTGQGTLAVVRVFLGSGVHHIFIGPDHILFIVGLLLLGGSFSRLIKIVTAFTLAHSVTLALAATGVVNPPGRVIEPAIAASIVYVGVDNLRHRPGGRDWRARIAFGFGFVHGFGFASVLREFGLPPVALGWSLFSFNLGVEVGQAAIVSVVAPLLALMRARAPRAAPGLVTAGAWGVTAAGAYWLVERVFFP